VIKCNFCNEFIAQSDHAVVVKYGIGLYEKGSFLTPGVESYYHLGCMKEVF